MSRTPATLKTTMSIQQYVDYCIVPVTIECYSIPITMSQNCTGYFGLYFRVLKFKFPYNVWMLRHLVTRKSRHSVRLCELCDRIAIVSESIVIIRMDQGRMIVRMLRFLNAVCWISAFHIDIYRFTMDGKLEIVVKQNEQVNIELTLLWSL